ncbi:OmpA family protein [Natribacillus halophilus]|uniref:OmpA family protein n=1 Tax=Natribacillus halophilus TaxID=549003 RepID=A0A1G8SST4_9BACI|nr:OmpA family protein [Natribacillus halophilus]SDJ32332.1 OmpA family protein [Natribacillus halophilus]
MTMEEDEVSTQVPNDILFDFDESELKSDAEETIDELIDEFDQLPDDTIIHINGHTDNVGDEDYNMELSEERAESVLDYIEENSDTSDLQFETFGYGETEPLETEADDEEAERMENRRVEIVINPDENEEN